MQMFRTAGLVLLCLAVLPHFTLAEQCVFYTPGDCAFGHISMSNNLCRPQGCFFEADEVFKCSFTEWGLYNYTDQPQEGCKDPFMTTNAQPPRPCGDRCCDADLKGEFNIQGVVPGTCASKYVFQPNETACSYDEISRGQLLDYFKTHQSGILVAGDSMMRQLYLRLVLMMRGQERLLDYHVHTHAQYRVCPEADMFRISKNNPFNESVEPADEFLVDVVPEFYNMETGPGANTVHRILNKCTDQPTAMDYLHTPLYTFQARTILAYLDTLPAGYKPIVLLSVGYWEGGRHIPQQYIDMLLVLRQRAQHVFLVTIPRVKVPETKADRRYAYWRRNLVMRELAEELGDMFSVLDFDTASFAPNVPPGGTNNNWHYMCSIGWRINCINCELLHLDQRNGLTPRGYRAFQGLGNVEKITVTEDGECVDEMNRNLWQMVFNSMLHPAIDESWEEEIDIEDVFRYNLNRKMRLMSR